MALRKYFMFSLSCSLVIPLYRSSSWRKSSTGCSSSSLMFPLTKPCVFTMMFSTSLWLSSAVMVCFIFSTSAATSCQSFSAPWRFSMQMSKYANSALEKKRFVVPFGLGWLRSVLAQSSTGMKL